MPFDTAAAQQAGYSDADILSHLTVSRHFDIEGAHKAGYSDKDIIQHLSSTPAPGKPRDWTDSAHDFASAAWEGTGKPLMDLMGGASRDPEAAHKSVETAKALITGLAGEPARMWEESKQTGEALLHGDISGAAHHAAGMTPILGSAAQQVGSDFSKGDYSKGFGHAVGLLAPFIAPEAAGLVAKAAPVVAEGVKAAGTAIAETAKRPAVAGAAGAVVGGGLGHATGIPGAGIVGAVAGREIGRDIASGLRKSRAVTEAPAPVAEATPAEAAPVTEPIRIIPAEGGASTPRSDWRQAIVDEANKKPAEVPGPSNTITNPQTAENAPQISGREAGNRSKLAQDLASKLHESGAPWDDVRKLSPGDGFWKTLRSTVRGDAKQPSPATVQLALEHLKTLEEANGAPKAMAAGAAPAETGLRGRSLDIARKLHAEMSQ